MKIFVFNEQKDLPINTLIVKNIVKSILQLEKKFTDEVSVNFVSTAEIAEIHHRFFNDPSPTDCISFPIDQETKGIAYHVLGEVFVCPKIAIEYFLNKKDQTCENVYQETTLYLVHALLHLLGYKDKKETEKKNMRAAEKRHMHNLLSQNLFLSP